MPEFRVEWVVDVYAANALEAARQARELQLDPDSTAVVFQVRDEAGESTTVDLEDVCRTDGCAGDPWCRESWDGYCDTCHQQRYDMLANLNRSTRDLTPNG